MTNDLTLTLTRHINASPATVWRCWTDPELLVKWFAPDPVEVVTCEVDPTPGGLFNVIMQMPGHDPMVGPCGLRSCRRQRRAFGLDCGPWPRLCAESTV
jgi:uncharacterized protein YndB with AHSA1/START domain